MLRHPMRHYSDALDLLGALMVAVYPEYKPREEWIQNVAATAGVEFWPEEPTISQTYALTGFLLDQLQAMYQEEERLL